MKIRILACLLVLALSGSVSARPVAAPSNFQASSSLWQHFIDFFRGFHPFSRYASDHTLPPPSPCTWSNG